MAATAAKSLHSASTSGRRDDAPQRASDPEIADLVADDAGSDERRDTCNAAIMPFARALYPGPLRRIRPLSPACAVST